ncbi:MAG: hypothetical protein NTW28_03540 [Candidatus Solibacter sp.]|nr:hypothetical protein [Candidatus Solibacter sp.]
MRRCVSIGVLTGMVCLGARAAEWESGYQERLKKLVGARTWAIGPGTSDEDAGKRDWPALLAELWKARGEPARQQELIRNQGAVLLASRWAGTFYKPFTAPGYTLYYSQYKDALPGDQLERIRNMVRRDAWNYLMRVDHHMDPIYRHTEFNSENFNWMARMAGVFWSHEFGDREKQRYFDSYLDNLLRAWYAAGRVEWNSSVYWGYTFQAALVLYESTRDAKVKEQARAILDWMSVEAALHYFDGFQAGPDVRAKTGAYRAFTGSVWPYAFLYFTDGEHPAPYSDAEAAARFGVQEVGYVPYATYRPPRAAIEIAQRKFQTPVEIQSAKPYYGLDGNNYGDWHGQRGVRRRFEFETLYLDRDFTLASLATMRPDGTVKTDGQMPFSEQNLWRLAVKGGQIFGNAGDNDTLAGRSPFEEIAQYANVVLRAVKGTDRMWVAVPRRMQVEMMEGAMLVPLGDGLVAHLTAKGQRSGIVLPRHTVWSDAAYQQYVWTFAPDEVGALAMEVGRGMLSGELGMEVDDVVRYRFGGKELRMQFVAPVTYMMADGSVVKPAGTLPRAWRDGVAVGFQRWDSYRVVAGEQIVEQKWGGDTLEAMGLKIRVDARTARVERTER